MRALPLIPGRSMPVVPEMPATGSMQETIEWLQAQADRVQDLVSTAAVVLLRGFDMPTAEDFRAICAAIEPVLRPYTDGDSPRTGVADRVYTSTEYDAELEVLLHNELSYAGWQA